MRQKITYRGQLVGSCSDYLDDHDNTRTYYNVKLSSNSCFSAGELKRFHAISLNAWTGFARAYETDKSVDGIPLTYSPFGGRRSPVKKVKEHAD